MTIPQDGRHPATPTDEDVVRIWTDGACKGNPGPGGWGAILVYRDSEKEISGGEKHTTNNRMELLAAISALETLTRPCNVVIYTDSQYLKTGITKWCSGWIRRNWLTATGTPVANDGLWKRLLEVTQRHKIKWIWVRGHAGNPMNERADRLATHALDDFRRP